MVWDRSPVFPFPEIASGFSPSSKKLPLRGRGKIFSPYLAVCLTFWRPQPDIEDIIRQG
jgi:hypothetical protein